MRGRRQHRPLKTQHRAVAPLASLQLFAPHASNLVHPCRMEEAYEAALEQLGGLEVAKPKVSRSSKLKGQLTPRTLPSGVLMPVLLPADYAGCPTTRVPRAHAAAREVVRVLPGCSTDSLLLPGLLPGGNGASNLSAGTCSPRGGGRAGRGSRAPAMPSAGRAGESAATSSRHRAALELYTASGSMHACLPGQPASQPDAHVPTY